MDERRGKAIPIYSTTGDWAAMLLYPFLYDTLGEWIGWVTADHEVFNVEGMYVGYLGDEPRILRRRTYEQELPRREPPAAPDHLEMPSIVPLPPFFRELPYEVIDVIDEDPDRLHPSDFGEHKEDLD